MWRKLNSKARVLVKKICETRNIVEINEKEYKVLTKELRLINSLYIPSMEELNNIWQKMIKRKTKNDNKNKNNKNRKNKNNKNRKK